MPQIIKPSRTKVKIVPKDGELEITLNINISVDGKTTISSDEAEVAEEKVTPLVPDFTSGFRLPTFGKKS